MVLVSSASYKGLAGVCARHINEPRIGQGVPWHLSAARHQPHPTEVCLPPNPRSLLDYVATSVHPNCMCDIPSC